MIQNMITVLATVCLSSAAFAGVLTTTPGAKSIENVKIASTGSVEIENQQIPVSIVGAGLRAKKVAIMTAKVYVAELLSSDSSKFVRTEADALNSLEQSRTIALRLSFVRTVDAPTVQSSFVEALKANKVNTSEAAVAQFLKAVAQGGDAVSGKSLTIITQKNADKNETVYYEDAQGKVTKVAGGQGFSRNLMSIWLGVPADPGIATLKKQLIQGL